MTNPRIYLDYGATTPIDHRVLAAIFPHLESTFGNPSSLHFFGQRAEKVLDDARRNIAELLGVQPTEIIFTSSGSESDNLALRGGAIARRQESGCQKILISPIEHPAVSNTARQLAEQDDFLVELIPVDKTGQIQLDEFESLLGTDVALVSVMAANNEIGTLNPIREIGTLCREHQIPFHSDAVQYGAHHPMDLSKLPIDMVSLGAHKFYGPKGVGILYVRSGTPLLPVQTGGSQEFGLRAATENVPLIAGMAKAFQLVQEEASQRAKHVIPLQEKVIQTILNTIPDSKLTGAAAESRLPNHASFVFLDLDGNLLIQALDSEGFACSSGSACKTGDPKPSSVLTHLGYPPEWALGSLRITLGKDTTQNEVDQFLQVLPGCIERVREVGK
jgi:cysteine desulfurase